eukprot:792968-Amphidinium_carterae.1
MHQVHDGGVTDAMRGFISGLCVQKSLAERVGQHGMYRRRDMLLHTSVKCALHDASNSLKWGWEKSFPA